MKPTVSVIIPTWNSAHTLIATIQSCLDQTVPPIEILVCDDGSTDESRVLVEQLHDPRVQWIDGAHSGTPAVPRNTGMRMAQGEWLAFCDSDDIWLPTKLEKQLALIAKTHCKAVCTNALIKKNGIVATDSVSHWTKRTITFKNLLKNNDVVCSSAMIHSSIFKDIGGFSEVVEYGAFADYIYWLRVATKTDFAFVSEALVIYDDHPTTSLRSTFLSGTLLKEKSLHDFVEWAMHRKGLSSFITQVRFQRLREQVKKAIRTILCFKKS